MILFEDDSRGDLAVLVYHVLVAIHVPDSHWPYAYDLDDGVSTARLGFVCRLCDIYLCLGTFSLLLVANFGP